jgi:predicted  nucleic acid-binding Zn-ribbon protein
MGETSQDDRPAEREKAHGIGHVVKEIEANLEERLIAAEEMATATSSAEVNLASALEAVVTNPHEHERNEGDEGTRPLADEQS